MFLFLFIFIIILDIIFKHYNLVWFTSSLFHFDILYLLKLLLFILRSNKIQIAICFSTLSFLYLLHIHTFPVKVPSNVQLYTSLLNKATFFSWVKLRKFMYALWRLVLNGLKEKLWKSYLKCEGQNISREKTLGG